jgi:hypothetical protein
MALTVSATGRLASVVYGVPSTVTKVEVSRTIGISGTTEELSLIKTSSCTRNIHRRRRLKNVSRPA